MDRKPLGRGEEQLEKMPKGRVRPLNTSKGDLMVSRSTLKCKRRVV